jgi:hypothetical protein
MLRLENRCGETTVCALASVYKRTFHLSGKKNPLRFQPLVRASPKSPEMNAFPKLELLKTLLSFLRPWAPTSISVKQQFASATPNKFIE